MGQGQRLQGTVRFANADNAVRRAKLTRLTVLPGICLSANVLCAWRRVRQRSSRDFPGIQPIAVAFSAVRRATCLNQYPFLATCLAANAIGAGKCVHRQDLQGDSNMGQVASAFIARIHAHLQRTSACPATLLHAIVFIARRLATKRQPVRQYFSSELGNLYTYAKNNPQTAASLQVQAPAPPVQPLGLWRCADWHQMELVTFAAKFEENCMECTERCRIRVYGQRCFHESVEIGNDSDPTKAYTNVYVHISRTSRRCGDKRLDDRETTYGMCKLYPLRLIAPSNPLDVAVKKYLKNIETCKIEDFSTLCDELQKVDPPPAIPKKN